MTAIDVHIAYAITITRYQTWISLYYSFDIYGRGRARARAHTRTQSKIACNLVDDIKTEPRDGKSTKMIGISAIKKRKRRTVLDMCGNLICWAFSLSV